MANRYTRDELVRRGLDLSQVSALKVHDCPANVVREDAYAVDWLQEIIDFWFHTVPQSQNVHEVSLNIPATADTVVVPADFILDVRNGYIIQTNEHATSKKRMRRLPLQKWISARLYYQGESHGRHSVFYTVQNRSIRVTPTCETIQIGYLWHYFLPPRLESNEIPEFVSDYVLIEYIRIKALEWCGQYDVGTSVKYCDKLVTGMKAAGLMNEPEDDEIPFAVMGHSYSNRGTYAWMGPQ